MGKKKIDQNKVTYIKDSKPIAWRRGTWYEGLRVECVDGLFFPSIKMRSLILKKENENEFVGLVEGRGSIDEAVEAADFIDGLLRVFEKANKGLGGWRDESNSYEYEHEDDGRCDCCISPEYMLLKILNVLSEHKLVKARLSQDRFYVYGIY